MSKSLLKFGFAALMCFSAVGNADPYCAPRIDKILHELEFYPMYLVLTDEVVMENIVDRTELLEKTGGLSNYNTLLQQAYNLVNQLHGSVVLEPVTEPDLGNSTRVISPRVVITEPDGTVIIDTGAWEEVEPEALAGPWLRLSTYDNWLNKEVNENHNSRAAILFTQIYPCGIAAERKHSSSLGVFQRYVAVRLGDYLKNFGTLRASTTVNPPAGL